MTLILITEASDFDNRIVEPLIEKVKMSDGSYKESYYIIGPYIQCDVKNRNGRKYPKELMMNCVEKYKSERMNPKFGFRSYGELGHPEGTDINLDKVCIYIQDLQWQGNDCIGKSKVIEKNPCGRILASLLEEKLRVGVSTRGVGTLSEETDHENCKIVESYTMIAEDVVADPSAPKGFVQGILEHKQYIIGNDGIITECYNSLEQKLKVLPKKSDERAKLFVECCQSFLNDIKNS
jgi:hypothetical protein